MRWLFTILVVAIIIIAGIYFFAGPGELPEEIVSTTEPEPGSRPSPTAPGSDQSLKEEAESYIREISEQEEEPVKAETANEFITRDQVISLAGKQTVEQLKPSELLQQEGITENTPITVVTKRQQVETMDRKQILSEAGGKLDAPITVLEGNEIRETTVEEVLKSASGDEPVAVVKNIEQFEILTPAEILADESINKDKPLNIIREPYRLETTTIGELLMGEKDVREDSVFYVRNVSEEDVQGIWGIVHSGLIENFASGIALRRGETIRKYRIHIPRDADEMKDDDTSSYLGRLIQKKTSESFVYNYKRGNMGRNPDLIYPGQEIIIISFSPEELIGIYQHFVENANS